MLYPSLYIKIILVDYLVYIGFQRNIVLYFFWLFFKQTISIKKLSRYIAFLLVLSPAIYAKPSLRFANIDIDGIKLINYLYQGHQGFIWMGADSGIYRYDGYSYQYFHYNSNDPSSLPGGNVTHILEDPWQRLWVSTFNGLARFEPISNNFKTFTPSPEQGNPTQNRQIRKMVADGTKGLWLASRLGLQFFDFKTETFTFYQHDPLQADSLAKNNVDTIAIDKQGGIWAATWPAGVDYLKAGSDKFIHYQINSADNSPLAKNVRALLVDSQQRVWFGTEGGVFIWHSEQGWKQHFKAYTPEIEKSFRVIKLSEDHSGNIWATTTAGLLHWNESLNQFDTVEQNIGSTRKLNRKDVYTILLDRSHSLWISGPTGIKRADLSLKGFAQIKPQSSRGSETYSIYTMISADSNNLWLSDLNEVHLFNIKTQKIIKKILPAYSYKNQLINPSILAMHQQPEGPLWLGIREGLLRYNLKKETFKHIDLGDAGSNFVNVIASGNKGNLWLGTGGGLIEYSSSAGILRHFKHDPINTNSISINSIAKLMISMDGKVWLSGGILGGGLNILDPETSQIERYSIAPDKVEGLASDFITDIKETPDGVIWLATRGGLIKVLKMANGKLDFHHFDELKINNSKIIQRISFDKSGKLWLKTSTKLLHFDPETEKYIKYSIFSENTWDWPYGGVVKGVDGVMYFNTVEGLITVNTEKTQQNQLPPKTSITDIKVLNHSLGNDYKTEEVILKGSITKPELLILPWNRQMFSIHFSAMHYASPKLNQYQYKLEGFDENWLKSESNNRIATYTNLDPGEYVFRVKSSSNTDIWDETGVSLPIIITPPYWGTLWFRSIVVIAFISLLLGSYFWRIRQLKKIQLSLETQVSKRTEELTKAVQIKSDFLANMSHEIRTPMNAIIGMTHLTLQTDLTAKQRNYQDKINTSAKWLLGILNDILDFSKLESGKIKLEHINFTLESIIQYLSDVTSSSLSDKQLTFNVKVAQDIPSILIGDPLRLGQILLNFLNNAIKFTKTGSITLVVQLLETGSERVDLRFSVTDTGIGLSEEQQAHLFRAFEQADNSTTRLYGGTGLGLAISKQLVEAMNGSIGVKSNQGEGSTFFFTISVGVQAATQVSPFPTLPTPVLDNFNGVTILLVEDNLINQELMLDILNNKGIEVDIANDGSEAVSMVANRDYSVVLMDCQMPVMNGYDASIKMRANSRYTDLPIIAMTANVLTEDKQRCFDSGMNDYIAKPIDWDLFFQVLSRWVKPASDKGMSVAATPKSKQGWSELSDKLIGFELKNIELMLSGRQEKYLHLLRLFKEQILRDAPVITESIESNNIMAAQDQLHSLKGGAANLGAKELQESCATLEAGLKAEPYDVSSLTRWSASINSTIDVLSTVLPDDHQEKITQKPTLLIIDSNRKGQEFLVSILSQEYHIKVTGNGVNALNISLKSPQPDLILLNMTEPQMDGFEISKQLKKNSLTCNIPVIFITETSNHDAENMALQLGEFDYISKPIDKKAALQLVRQKLLF